MEDKAFWFGRTTRGDGSSWRLFLLYIAAAPLLAAEDAKSGTSRANVASAAHGTIAVALFSQETFDAALAIDGELENARGWAYHGRLEMASIVFAFDRPYDCLLYTSPSPRDS